MKELIFKLVITQDMDNDSHPEDVADHIVECLENYGFDENVYISLMGYKEMLDN